MNLTSRGTVRLQIVKIGGIIEKIVSPRYEFDLRDKYGNDVRFTVMGIEKISRDIVAVNLPALKNVCKGINLYQLERPKSGEIGCLIGYEYADFHPIKKDSVGHLLLLENRFGFVIAGAHSAVGVGVEKLLFTHANKTCTKMVQFFEIVSLGVECISRCGSC